MKKLVLLTGLSILLAACGETSVEKVESSEKTASESTESSKEETKETPEVFVIGDTVAVDGVNISLVKASFTDPTEYSPSAKGKVLTLEFNVENTTDTRVFVDSSEFNLYDAEGNQLESYFGYDEMALSSDLNAGKKTAGKMYFDVPEGTNYELIYSPMFSFDSKEIKWDVAVQ